MSQSRSIFINFGIQGTQQAAQGMQNVAAQTTAAAQAMAQAQQRAATLQQQLQQLQAAAPTLPLAQAPAAQALGQQLGRGIGQAQTQALGYQLGILQPPAGGGGGGGYQNPLAGTGLARLATPLFALHAAAAVAGGTGKGLEDVARQATTASDAFDMMAKRMAESIPIIGGFVRGIESLGDTMSGAASIRAGAADFVRGSGAQNAYALYATQQRMRAQAEIGGLRIRGGDLAGQADAAAAWSGGLTPGRLASYQQYDAFGNLDASGNSARRARDVAQVAADAAAATVRRREMELAGAQANVEGIGAAEPGIRGDILRASQRAQGLFREASQMTPGSWRKLGREARGQEAMGDVGAGIGRLESNLAAQDTAQVQVQERLKALHDAQEGAARAQFEVSQKQLEIDKLRVTELERQRGTMLRGQEEAGFRGPEENRMRLELARAGRANPSDLTSEQWAVLRGDPLFAQFAQQTGQRLGGADPSVIAAQREFGFGAVGDLERQRNDLAAAVEKGAAAAQETMAKAVQDSWEKIGQKIADVIEKAMDVKLATFAAKQEQDAANKLAQRKPA